MPSPLSTLKHIVEYMVIEPPSTGPITEEKLNASSYVKAKLGPAGTVGIKQEAADSLFNFVESMFGDAPHYQRGATFKDFFDAVADIIIAGYVGRPHSQLVDDDDQNIRSQIAAWFAAVAAKRQLYIPCMLSPHHAPPFVVGPVSFRYVSDFVSEERIANEATFDFTFGQLLSGMSQGPAHWMATVEVDGCTKERAWEIGNLTVDIAIAGLQLVVPLDQSKHMARMTARAAPRWGHAVSRSNGATSMETTNSEPGLILGTGALHHFLQHGNQVMEPVGRRVAAFVTGGAALPRLEQAWADASYWFHEGLAEPLDTIAVPKLETAIEVMLRAESSSGSKARLIKAIETFYGLTSKQLINPQSQTTVEAFAKGFVTDRSMVLHGTLSTLQGSLRNSRASLATLARGLLAFYVAELDAYAGSAGAADDLEAFLLAVRTRRQNMAMTPNTGSGR